VAPESKTPSTRPRETSFPIITLLTDFGAGSGYPAQMKGVIARAAPEARIIDISHEVPPFDVLSGALLLEACAPHFPIGAIHCAVVDPGVGTSRRALCLLASDGRRFVGPDNGLFTPFLGEHARAFEITDRRIVCEPASATFHGRDLFAPIAAWLARGGDPEQVGPRVADPIRLDWPEPVLAGEELSGVCLQADRFGNLVTNIAERHLHGYASIREVRVEGRAARFVRTYAEGRPGELLALLGSAGRLEIAVRERNTAVDLGLGRGARVVVWLAQPRSPSPA
jgi:S-adenosylmethionine hydrolase